MGRNINIVCNYSPPSMSVEDFRGELRYLVMCVIFPILLYFAAILMPKHLLGFLDIITEKALF